MFSRTFSFLLFLSDPYPFLPAALCTFYIVYIHSLEGFQEGSACSEGAELCEVCFLDF